MQAPIEEYNVQLEDVPYFILTDLSQNLAFLGHPAQLDLTLAINKLLQGEKLPPQ